MGKPCAEQRAETPPHTPTLGIGSLRHQSPGSPPFIPRPPAQATSARTGEHPAGLSRELRAFAPAGRSAWDPGRSPSDAHNVLHLRAEERRGPRLAGQLPTPWYLAGPDSAVRPGFIEKTLRLYRLGQPGGRLQGGGPRPMGSAGGAVKWGGRALGAPHLFPLDGNSSTLSFA